MQSKGYDDFHYQLIFLRKTLEDNDLLAKLTSGELPTKMIYRVLQENRFDFDSHYDVSMANDLATAWEILRHDVYAAELLMRVSRTRLTTDVTYVEILERLLPNEEFDNGIGHWVRKTTHLGMLLLLGKERLKKHEVLMIVADVMKRTPDGFDIYIDEDGTKTLLIIDYAVSYDFRKVVESKLEKYQEDCETLKDLFNGLGLNINCRVKLFIGDLREGRDLFYDNGRVVSMNLIKNREFFDVFDINFRYQLALRLTSEERDLFESIEEPDDVVKFEIKPNKRAVGAINSTGFSSWIKGLVKESGEQELFDMLLNSYSADTPSDVRHFCRQKMESTVTDVCSTLWRNARMMPAPLRAPTEETIREAFEEMSLKILSGESKFKEIEVAKPNFHFNWPATSDVLLSEVGDTKKQAITNMVQNVEGALFAKEKVTDLDQILGALSNLTDSEYKEFEMKGMVCDKEPVGGFSIRKEYGGRSFYIPTNAGKKKRGTISFSRVGPHLNEKMLQARVGMEEEDKKREKEDNVKHVKQGKPNVESLPFWSETEVEQHDLAWSLESEDVVAEFGEPDSVWLGHEDMEEMQWLSTTLGYKALKDIGILYKNIMFNSQCHRRKKISIATCPNKNLIAIVLPGEDLQSSNGSSFYFLTKQTPETLVLRGLDEGLAWKCKEGNVYSSKTIRLDKVRMRSLSTAFAKFCILFKTLYTVMRKKRIKETIAGTRDNTDFKITCAKMAFYSVTNVSINMSSLLDNVRYLVLGAAGLYSGVADFIRDKMDVAVKTTFQMHLYKRTMKILREIGTKRMDLGAEDIEGALYGDFSGLSGDDLFSDLVDVVQESYSLFFSVEKGLHNYFHAMVDIHKVAFEYQCKSDQRDKYIQRKMIQAPMFCYNPKVMMISSFMTNDFSQKQINKIRGSFKVQERPFKNPLTVKTMSSLKKCVSHKPEETVKNMSDLEEDFKRDSEGNTVEECNEAIPYSLRSLYEFHLEGGEVKLRMKKQKKLRGIALGRALKTESWAHFIEASSRTVIDSVLDLMEAGYIENKKPVVEDIWDTEQQKEVNMVELLNKSINRTVNKPEINLARVVRKFQRTQKDREIYLVSIENKVMLYFVEHFYKQVNRELPEEWISIPGDRKYVELNKLHRSDGMGYTGDCSKWSAGDNQDKFIFNIVGNVALTKQEKMLFMFIIYLYKDKKLLLDNDMCNYLKSMSDAQKGAIHENPFFILTEGMTKNYANINRNWLQGQLNYLSSNVHACCARICKTICLREMRMQMVYAVHSDDFMVSFDDQGDESTKKFLKLSSLLMSLHCITLNIKKSFVHKRYIEMVSMIMYYGEARPSWVKLIMSAVSGLPYMGFEQDRSSTVSKISSALNQSCPPSVAKVAYICTMDETMRTYSMHKTGVNNPSLIFKRDTEEIPSFLGGWGAEDSFDICCLGSRAHDARLLFEYLKKVFDELHYKDLDFRRSFSTFESFLDNFEETERFLDVADHEVLNWFWIRLELMKDCVSDDWESSELLGSLFTFRKFLNLKLKYNSKLYKLYPPEVWNEFKSEWMKDHPSYSILKPQNTRDLKIYFRVLLDNSSFLRSYTNQSQEQLMINRIRSSKDKIMSIPGAEVNLKESLAASVGIFTEGNVTIKEGLEWFKNIKVRAKHSDINRVINLWLLSDPKVKTWLNVRENTFMSNGYSFKIAVPRKLPEPESQYIFSAPVPTLLQWTFDLETFERDGKEISRSKALEDDLEYVRKFKEDVLGARYDDDMWGGIRVLYKLLTQGFTTKITMMPTGESGTLSIMWCQLFRGFKKDFYIVPGGVLEDVRRVANTDYTEKDLQNAATNFLKKLSDYYPDSLLGGGRYMHYLKDICLSAELVGNNLWNFMTVPRRNPTKNYKLWHYFLTNDDLGLAEEYFNESRIITLRTQPYDPLLDKYVGVYEVMATIRGSVASAVKMQGIDSVITNIAVAGNHNVIVKLMNDLKDFLDRRWRLKKLNFDTLYTKERSEFCLESGKVFRLTAKKRWEDSVNIYVTMDEELNKHQKEYAQISYGEKGEFFELDFGNRVAKLKPHFVDRVKLRNMLRLEESKAALIKSHYNDEELAISADLKLILEYGLFDTNDSKYMSQNVKWLMVMSRFKNELSKDFLKSKLSDVFIRETAARESVDLDEILSNKGLKGLSLKEDLIRKFSVHSKETSDLYMIAMSFSSKTAVTGWDFKTGLSIKSLKGLASVEHDLGNITAADLNWIESMLDSKPEEGYAKPKKDPIATSLVMDAESLSDTWSIEKEAKQLGEDPVFDFDAPTGDEFGEATEEEVNALLLAAGVSKSDRWSDEAEEEDWAKEMDLLERAGL